MKPRRRPILVWIAAGLSIVFGLMTIRSGGSVLFVESAREAAGDFVPFVVWFNFSAGFAYVAVGVGLVLRADWSVKLALLLAVATLAVFAAFGVHVSIGGAYMMRTVVAMSLRSVIWIVIAGAAQFVWRPAGVFK